jgi:hypothetical protein
MYPIGLALLSGLVMLLEHLFVAVWTILGALVMAALWVLSSQG